MAPGETQPRKAYCLLAGDAMPLALGLDAIETVIEPVRIVPLPLSPGAVPAVCTYRGGFLPVVTPGSSCAATPVRQGARRPAILVLRTGHGLLGLAIDRAEIAVVEDLPDEELGGGAGLGPAALPDGLVASGAIRRDGRIHAILDPDRSWAALRDLVERSQAGCRRGERPAGPLAGLGSVSSGEGGVS